MGWEDNKTGCSRVMFCEWYFCENGIFKWYIRRPILPTGLRKTKNLLKNWMTVWVLENIPVSCNFQIQFDLDIQQFFVCREMLCHVFLCCCQLSLKGVHFFLMKIQRNSNALQRQNLQSLSLVLWLTCSLKKSHTHYSYTELKWSLLWITKSPFYLVACELLIALFIHVLELLFQRFLGRP